MVHDIDVPHPNDAAPVGRMQLKAWLQTYPNEEAGIDEAWIREHRGSAVTAEGIAQWREFIEDATRQPDLLFCRVVRSGAEIVGFLCGRRDEAVVLGPMYLLDEAQGQGVGGQLMGEFLVWAQDAPMRLWVTDYNKRAIRFYERYGFRTTGERELWRGKLPNVRMTREPLRAGRSTTAPSTSSPGPPGTSSSSETGAESRVDSSQTPTPAIEGVHGQQP